VLGVDLGTTYTAAAVGRQGRSEIYQLGTNSSSIPSLVVVGENGEAVVGEAAERRAALEPTRTGREFKRRLGDTTPLMLGGTPYTPEALMAIVLRWVVARVSETEGGPPRQVVLTHPANFGPYKLDLMREVGRLADLDDIVLIAEPQAAAVSYAQRSAIDTGAVVAVYDFGGGTFDAALVRRTSDGGFELLGTPTGIDRLGGIDIDQAVLGHVVEHLSADLDANDPAIVAASAQLRDGCRRAKEALSTDASAVVPVNLPGINTTVTIDRNELDNLIRSRVIETIEATQRAVRLSGLQLTDIDRVLLVGGTSRMPLVADLLRTTLQRPVALDASPKNAICLGAALIASQPAAAPAAFAAPTVAAPVAAAAAAAATEVIGAVPPPPSAATPPARSRKGLLIGIGVAALAVVAIGVVVLAGGGDDASTAPTTPVATEQAVTVAPETVPAATEPLVTDPIAGFVQQPWNEADGRVAQFGPFDYEITAIDLSNSDPPFADDATLVGPAVVRVSFDLDNRLAKEGSDFDTAYVLQLANGDEIQGSKDAVFVGGGTSGEQEVDFVLGADVALDDSTLTGATLVFAEEGGEAVRSGIPLSGSFEAAPEPDAIDIGSAPIDFDTVNERHSWEVLDARVSFDDTTAQGGGTYTTRDTRAEPGKVWVMVTMRFGCISGAGGCGAFDASVRLDADGSATDARSPFSVLSPGTSEENVLAFQVDADATAYTMLISPAGDLSAPQTVTLPINAAIADLVESQQQFQPT